MKKRILPLFAYTVFVAVVSALITTAWFHTFVFNQKGDVEQQALVSLAAGQAGRGGAKWGQAG